MSHLIRAALSAILPICLSACGVPKFDIPEEAGSPTVNSIVKRVTCELVDMIKDDQEPGFKHRPKLLSGDYQVGVSLSLTVLDSGALAPSVNYFPNTVVSYNAGFLLSKSRQQNFTQNYFFSMNDLRHRWDQNHDFGRCPPADTNLAGELGLKSTVDLAMNAPASNVALTLSGTQGEFGGYVEFGVIRNVNALGPTWTLKHFKGPGGLGSLSRTNTDRITFAFAPSKPAAGAANKEIPAARVDALLYQLYLQQIGMRDR